MEEALFDNEFPTVITGQEKTRDYEGPAYEVIGRNNGGQYLLVVIIYVGDHEGIVLTAYFLNRDEKSEQRKIKRYHDITGGLLS